jgi:hypothetical protein
MATAEVSSIETLYEQDETAWLEAMAGLLRSGTYADLDHVHLLEYLTDMAKRDRREVESRLTVLIAHVLKWVHQPDHRSRSWLASIIEQRQELERLAGHEALRNHAQAVLADVYRDAVERAVAETGLSPEELPEECRYSLEELLSFDPGTLDG